MLTSFILLIHNNQYFNDSNNENTMFILRHNNIEFHLKGNLFEKQR